MKTLPALGALILALILQAGLAPYIAVGGVTPNMFLLIVVTVAFVQGPRSGTLVGFMGGLLFDLVGTGPIGPAALVLCIIGFLVGSLQENTFAEGWTLPLVVLFFAGLLSELFYALSLAVLSEAALTFTAVFQVMLPSALYNVVLAILVYPWLARFLREERSMPIFRRL